MGKTLSSVYSVYELAQDERVSLLDPALPRGVGRFVAVPEMVLAEVREQVRRGGEVDLRIGKVVGIDVHR